MTDVAANSELGSSENFTAPDVAQRNAPFTKEKLFQDVKRFGKAYGQGSNSRPAMAERAVEAAKTLPDVGPADAENIYMAFQKAAAASKGIEYKVEASAKQQVSKLRQFLEMGANQNIDAVDVFSRAKAKITELAGLEDSPLRGSAYDNLVNVARAQISSPDNALTDDEIEAVLSPEKVEKSILDKMIDSYKRLSKMFDSEELPKEALPAWGDAIHNIEQAIVDAGGTLPEKKPSKAESAKAAMLTRAAVIAARRAPRPANVYGDERQG